MNWLKWLVPLFLLGTAFSQVPYISGSLTAQSTACATAGSCLVMPVGSGFGAVTITLSGTFSGTTQFEATGDGSNWFAIGDTSSSAVSSATAAGVWQFNISGYTAIRARCSTYTSGTIAVVIKAGSPSASRRGGGSGTVTGAGVIAVTGSTVSLHNSGGSNVTTAAGTDTGYATFSGTTVSGDVIQGDSNGGTVDSGVLLTSLAPLAAPTFTTSLTSPCMTDSGSLDTVSCPLNVSTGPFTVGSSTALAVLAGTTGSIGGTCGTTALTPTSGQWGIACDSTNTLRFTVNGSALASIGSGGGGSGTVSSGTSGQMAYYAATGTTVSGTSTVPSGLTINLINPWLLPVCVAQGSGLSLGGTFTAAAAPGMAAITAGSSTTPTVCGAQFAIASSGGTQYMEWHRLLEAEFKSSSINAIRVQFYVDTATSGNVEWDVLLGCASTGIQPTYAAVQHFTATAVSAINTVYAGSISTPTFSCVAGNTMWVRLYLDTSGTTASGGNVVLTDANVALVDAKSTQ